MALFLFSLFFLWISLRSAGRVSKFFLVLSVFFPCLLAGMRGTSVGTDMRIYIIRYFNLAVKSNSFWNYIKMVEVTDYLYLFINYFVSRITNQIFFELFLQQALTIIPVYVSLFRIFKNKKSIFLGALLYFLFMYNSSFNIARQSIAISFEILGFSYLKEEKFKTAICIIISILFHNTAIFSLVPFAVFYLYNSKQLSVRFKFFLSACGCICCVLILCFITKLVPILSNFSLPFFQRLAGNMRFLRDKPDISISDFLLCFFCLILTFICRKKTKDFCYDINFFTVLALFGSILSQTGSIISFSQRASYYFLYPVIFIGLPYTISDSSIKYRNLHSERWIVFFFVAWWIFNILLRNANETLPYVFSFAYTI